jgi:tetratricopeptide (TPR) repeat protein
LSPPHFANALFLHIAALAAVVGDPAREEEALLRFVLVREERHWQDGLANAELSQDLDVSSVAQALALVTLAGGVENKAEARTLAGRAPNVSGLTPPKRDRLIDLLHRLYPGERYLEPVRPDLLGEDLVDRALCKDPELLKVAFIEDASRDQILNGLTVLARLAQRRPDAERWMEQTLAGDLERLAEPAIQVAIEIGHPMGKILAEALQKQPLGDPSRLEPLIPSKTTELLGVGVVVMAQQWSRLQVIPKPWAHDVKARAAEIATHLANRLSAAGRRQEALALAQEAADRYRALAEEAPDAYRHALATTLNNLGNRLSDVGRHREALAPAKEAVAIFRKLADEEPNVYEPDLAMALNNLSGCFSEAGLHKEALEVAGQATNLFRKLAGKAPDIFRPYLAGALGNLASRLSEVGQYREALASSQEVTELYGELAEKAPDAYRPDLAQALNNLAASLVEVERYEEAVKALLKGIRTLGPLFLRFPPAFSSLMSQLVGNYLGVCQELDREPDAELLAPILALLERT